MTLYETLCDVYLALEQLGQFEHGMQLHRKQWRNQDHFIKTNTTVRNISVIKSKIKIQGKKASDPQMAIFSR